MAWLVAWTAPSHYLNQCWNIVNWTLGNKLRENFNRNSNIFIQENAFENVVCEMASICLGLNELTPLLKCLLFGCSSSNNCGGCNAVFYKRRNGRPVPRCNSRYSSWWHHERKCCQHYWPFVMGIPGSLAITITNGQWTVILEFSLLIGGTITYPVLVCVVWYWVMWYWENPREHVVSNMAVILSQPHYVNRGYASSKWLRLTNPASNAI